MLNFSGISFISCARSFSSLTNCKLHVEIEGKSHGNGEYDSSLNPRRCDQQTGGLPSKSRVTKKDLNNGSFRHCQHNDTLLLNMSKQLKFQIEPKETLAGDSRQKFSFYLVSSFLFFFYLFILFFLHFILLFLSFFSYRRHHHYLCRCFV